MNCPFCQIVTRQLPRTIVYENQWTMVILPKNAAVDGHLLVMPKQHVTSIFTCDEDLLAQVTKTAKKVATDCVKSGDFEGINFLSAHGAAAQQSVNHLHIHLIPRKEGDGINAWPDFHGSKK
jgi:histidine triad (HIT) family protein